MSEQIQIGSGGNLLSLPMVRKGIGAVLLTANLLAGSACSGGEEAPTPAPETTIHQEAVPSHEEILALQHRATVQLRTSNWTEGDPVKGGVPPDWDQRDIDYNTTGANCSATHLGKGWFATAGHCLDAEIHVGGSFYDQIYDAQAAGEIRHPFSVWSGDTEDTMQKLGDVDAIIVHGNRGAGDLAFVHSALVGARKSDMATLEAMPITTEDHPSEVFSQDQGYVLTGYPQNDNFEQIQTPLEFLALSSGQAFQDSYGLDTSLDPLPIFGVRHTSSKATETGCTPGMSGGAVVNEQGEIVGVLSRYDSEGGTLWESMITDTGIDLVPYDMLCVVQPITEQTFRDFAGKVGEAPSPSTLIGGK